MTGSLCTPLSIMRALRAGGEGHRGKVIGVRGMKGEFKGDLRITNVNYKYLATE